MEIWFYIIVAAIFAVVVSLIPNYRKSGDGAEKKVYRYSAKSNIMTPPETEFFKRLSSIADGKYLVFPQIHLSAFIDFQVRGQNWKAALSHIDRKSVDYVLCDVKTLVPRYAVELDDFTHDRNDRKERDMEVERILKQAGVPLVRFRDNKISDDDIISRFSEQQI